MREINLNLNISYDNSDLFKKTIRKLLDSTFILKEISGDSECYDFLERVIMRIMF